MSTSDESLSGDHQEEGTCMVYRRHQQTHWSIQKMCCYVWRLCRKVRYNLENKVFLVCGPFVDFSWRTDQRCKAFGVPLAEGNTSHKLLKLDNFWKNLQNCSKNFWKKKLENFRTILERKNWGETWKIFVRMEKLRITLVFGYEKLGWHWEKF